MRLLFSRGGDGCRRHAHIVLLVIGNVGPHPWLHPTLCVFISSIFILRTGMIDWAREPHRSRSCSVTCRVRKRPFYKLLDPDRCGPAASLCCVQIPMIALNCTNIGKMPTQHFVCWRRELLSHDASLVQFRRIARALGRTPALRCVRDPSLKN